MSQPTLIITGASKGIGRATAALYLSRGFRVLNLSRSSANLAGVEDIAIDLCAADWGEAASTVEQAAKAASQLVLVHNAALLTKDSVADIEADSLRRVFELNAVAPARLNRLVLPHMNEGDALIYVASTLGEKAVANSFAYVSSKHAQVGMMKASCQDLAGSGIHTACVCPGFTDTEMLRAHVGHDESILQSLAQGVTMGRLIAPEEIADTIAACADNPVLNGAVVHANLGQVES